MNKKKNTTTNPLFLSLLLAGVTLTGCEDGGVSELAKQEGVELPSQESLDKASPYARFDPAGGVIPFPNNLLFNGSQDGTLNIPVADPEDYSDPQVAMNALDGFSTLTSFNAAMSAPLDPASILPGQTVRVYQVNLDPATSAVTGVSRELSAGREYTVGVSPFDNSTVVITPLAPLAPGSGYLVTLGKGLKSAAGENYTSELYYALAESGSALVDESGNSLFAALSDEDAQKLEPLRQLTNAAEAAVEGYTVAADTTDAIPDQSASDIILSWSFKTQSIGASLDAIAKASSSPTGVIETTPTGMDTSNLGLGIADIHTWTLDVPYYSSAPTAADPTAPLTGFWHTATGGFVTGYYPMPQETTTETIPVLMTLPNANSGHTTMPGTGWPVVIFQHGITQNRTHLLAVADTLAAAGFAGIAIDLPLHGITDATSPFYADGTATVARERTFGLDLVNNETRAPGPDSVPDPSGMHFINLKNLLTTRDNVRQAVADLMTLKASLSSVSALDESKVYFVGHSLGAMVGTPFLAHTPDVQAAVLGFPGGGIAKLLDGSATFGPEIAAGLATEGVVRGTQDYESFMLAAQTIVDTADPINYATGAVTGPGILMFEVVGGNRGLPDQVVPNNVLADAPAEVIPSPTAGTDPLARAMGLTQYGTTPPSDGITALNAWIRFTAGHHGSLVTPNDAAGNPNESSARVFSELHGEMASFLASDGTVLNITDDTVIEQPAVP